MGVPKSGTDLTLVWRIGRITDTDRAQMGGTRLDLTDHPIAVTIRV
jgi:hypothetical protein